MKMENLKQASFNTSMMGVIRGVLDYYDLNLSNGIAYAGSGHAFMINIHEVVCPSSPYCWKYDKFFKLLRNLGLEMTDLGFFHDKHTLENRNKIELTLRQHLDDKKPCSLLNMDNQTIYGYDDKALLLIQPWGDCVDVTPATLTYGTWQEFGKEIHCNFFVFDKVPAKDQTVIIKECLDYAVDIFENPKKYNYDKYAIGSGAYDNWVKAHEQGKAHEHGNWWNANVWSECRKMASEFFHEIAQNYDGEVTKQAQTLADQYKDIADLLMQVSDKKMPGDKKIPLIKQVKEKDEKAVSMIKDLRKKIS